MYAGHKRSNTINDNRLEYGCDEGEHNRNIAAKMNRAREKEITPKHSKSKICVTEAIAYNAKYGPEHLETKSYKEVKAHLR